MLLEKWSTSYLRSTMLKHKPRTAKSKITATNSLQRQPDCTAQKRWMRSGSLESLLSCPRLSCPAQAAAPSGPGSRADISAVPGHGCDTSGLGTSQSPPSSHASSAHRAHCANELGTDAEQTKTLVFISCILLGTPISYIR